MQAAKESITALLAEGGPEQMERIVELIYDDLRAMARTQLRRQAPGHTLCTTALVHEAYMKLANVDQLTDRGRTYFFGAASSAMRQILVDHARRRTRAKRGGDRQRVTLRTGLATDEFAEDLIELDAAMSRLAADSPRQARVVEYRYFGGMTIDETAEALGVSARTVKNDWAYARAWLFDALD